MLSKKDLYFTKHAKLKMREYGLSKTKVRNTLSFPERIEKGVASGTVAVMSPVFKKRYSEIWVMYQDEKSKRKIIAAWRYPGKSPVGWEISIPGDIKKILEKNEIQ